MTEIRSYDELHALLRAQIAKLGLGINQCDEIVGFAGGYMAKVLGPSHHRVLGCGSLLLLLPELGLELTINERPELLAKRRLPAQPYAAKQARNGNTARPVRTYVIERVCRHIAANGGRAAWKGTTKKQRSERMREVACARWVKPKRAR